MPRLRIENMPIFNRSAVNTNTLRDLLAPGSTGDLMCGVERIAAIRSGVVHVRMAPYMPQWAINRLNGLPYVHVRRQVGVLLLNGRPVPIRQWIRIGPRGSWNVVE